MRILVIARFTTACELLQIFNQYLMFMLCLFLESSPYSFCFSLLLLEQSDIDLRHSLANLVGAVLGCPPNSNHLWYHLFHPEELPGTYMTGFMVLYGYQKTLWPAFIHVLLTHTHDYHSTINRLAMVVIAMTVEWNFLLMVSMVDHNI